MLSKGGDVIPRPTSSDCACSPRAVMSCHARRRLPSGHSKGGDVMPRPTSYDRACSLRAVMSCHARHRLTICAFQKWSRSRSTVCAIQRQRCHATSDVVPPCVVPKGDDGMPRPTLSNCVCCLKAAMSCHARRYRPCVLSKGGDIMPHLTLPTVCAVQGRFRHATPDVADRVCCPRAVMS